MLSDLECDYINPIDLCNKLNQVPLIIIESKIQLVIPEKMFHAGLTLLFLLCFSLTAFLINLPLVVFNISRYADLTNTSGLFPE